MAAVLCARLIAAVALIVPSALVVQVVALLVIAITSWILTTRTGFGGDGSDQMGMIVTFGALALSAGLVLDDVAVSFSGMLLVGGQLAISYFVAGFSKLLSPTWRRGAALVGVMGTHSYGHALAAKISSSSATFSLVFCWLVILGEILFPLALLAPHELLVIVLAAFLLFHMSNAYFMGLNAFVWSFAATYPSALALSCVARTTSGLAG